MKCLKIFLARMKGIKADKAKKPGLLSSHASPSSWLNIFSFPIYPGRLQQGRARHGAWAAPRGDGAEPDAGSTIGGEGLAGETSAHSHSLHAHEFVVAEHGGTVFRDITENRICRGVFKSVPELEAAIRTDIANHNAWPKPFIWTASANDILAKVARARKVLNVIHISGDLH